jgi:hypothetical protein
VTERERWRFALLRRTRKPHLYREHGVWLMLEHTGPGEWWETEFDNLRITVACCK